MEPLNFFMSPEHLEPKCHGCRQRVDYGVTTKFDDNVQNHVCLSCGTPV